MNRTLEAKLARLKAERDRHRDAIRGIDRELGLEAHDAIETDPYVTLSSIGRAIGVSHTHVRNLIDAALESSPIKDPPPGIPVLDNVRAGEYVRTRGARIVRSISGFEPSDVLHQSGLDPRLFARDSRVDMPAMLWQLDNSEWVGVGMATVGYGGTGVGLAREALLAAGVLGDVAHQITSYRFCDAVDIDDVDTWTTSAQWPIHDRGMPSVVGDRVVVHFGENSVRSYYDSSASIIRRPSVDKTGFYPNEPAMTTLEAWLTFLNDESRLSDWARGTRVARVFLQPHEAGTQGFILAAGPGVLDRGRHSSPTIVIEQGHLQLWGHFYRPSDRSQLLPHEAYTALSLAGVYPHELAERDARSARPWGRFLHQILGPEKPLPPFVDVSESGRDGLQFSPLPPA